MHIIINNNYLTYNNYKAKCAVGKRGINLKKREGDLITPKGEFKIKFILYRKDRVKVRSKIKKIIIKKNMGWCDDPKTKYYNRLIKLPFKFTHEKLYKKKIYTILYQFLILIWIPKNKGSAIFIHVAKGNYKKTEGYVAIKKINY